MFARTTLFRASIKHRAPAALLCLGLGALGCSGGHFNLPTRASRGEEIAASARQETQRPAEADKQASSLARLLRMQREAPADEPDSAAEPRNGRIFSAFVDRRPDGSESAQDPFLAAETAASAQPDQPTRRVTRTAVRRGEINVPPAATGTAQQKLSDADLWKLLEAEGAVAAVASPAQSAAAAPQLADTPEWARGPSDAPAVTKTHTDYETPAFAQGATERPSGNLATTGIPEAPAPATASTADADRARVEALMGEAHRHAERGALHEAYHAAILAERLADREQLVFSPQQEQPADLARRLVEQMQTAPRHDPFGEISIAAVPDKVEAEETPTLAAPQFPGAARQQAGSAPPVAAAAPPPQRPAPATTGFNDAFPPVQEWRGVRANTPVSLAVVDDSPAPFRRAPEPVEHAVLNAPADQPLAGSSLPRHLQAPAGSLWTGRPEGPALTAGPELPGPALTRETDAARSTVAPPPPLDLGAEHRRGTEARTVEHAGAKQRRGGMVWWVFGALAMFAGAVLVKVRRRRSVTPA